MKFITLTKGSEALVRSSNLPVLLNPMTITALVDVRPADQLFNTQVYTMGSSCWYVLETVEEIQKLIKESENIHTITWETGPK